MRKIILLLNIILITICAILFYKTETMQSVDPSILRNEISYYNTINQEKIKDFRRLSYEVAEDVKDSHLEKIIACGNVAKKHGDLFEIFHNQSKKAYQVRMSSKLLANALDSILHLDQFIKANCQEYLTFEQNKYLVTNHSDNSAIAGINLLKLEHQAISKYYIVNDYLLRECTVPFCGFQTFEGFLATDLNPGWMSHEIDINVPTTMSTTTTERIFISLSKKAVDHLVDSLKKERMIDERFFNSYKTKISLKSKKILVQPLDKDIQPTLTSDNTVWEFDLTATEPGQISLIVEVGLIMNDMDSNSVTKHFSLPSITIDVQE